MLQRGHRRIIKFASLAARIGAAAAPVHHVPGKSGVPDLAKVIARGLGDTGLTINAINPGRIDTQIVRDVPDEVYQAIASRIPRWAGRVYPATSPRSACFFDLRPRGLPDRNDN